MSVLQMMKQIENPFLHGLYCGFGRYDEQQYQNYDSHPLKDWNRPAAVGITFWVKM